MCINNSYVHFLLFFAVKSAAERCIPFFAQQNMTNFYKLPDKIRRFNTISGEYVKFQFLKPKSRGLCTVDYEGSLEGKILRVGLYEELYPFVIHLKKKVKASGIFGDTWSILEDSLKFKSVYEKVEDANRALETGQVDLVLSQFPFVQSTTYRISSTLITKNAYSLFTISSGLRVPKWWYLHIFDRYIWFLLLFFVVILTLAIILASKIRNLCFKHGHAADEFSYPSFSLLCIVGAASGQGFQDMPRTWSLRLCALSTLQMGMLLSCGFNSTLTSYLALRSHELKFNSLDDVWKYQTHSLCVRYPSFAYNQIQEIIDLEDNPAEFKTKQWQLVNRNCPDMWNDLAIKRNLCEDGFIYVDSYHRFLMAYNEQNKCQIVKMQDDYWPLHLVFLHHTGSKYRKIIDKYLLRLHSSGILKRLENKYAYNPRKSYMSQNQNYQPVELGHVKILMAGLGAAMVISVIICLLENLWQHVICKKETTSLFYSKNEEIRFEYRRRLGKNKLI